jgi:hypothetical protein
VWGGGRTVIISNQPAVRDSFEKSKQQKAAAAGGKGDGKADGSAAAASADSLVLIVENPIGDATLAPIWDIVLLQKLLLRLAAIRGIKDPGVFRNCGKVTK